MPPDTPFVIEGDLWLKCQEGGYASDAWVLQNEGVEGLTFIEWLRVATSNSHLRDVELDNKLAEHFGAEREGPPGNRHIGRVRLTVERL